MLSPHFKNIEKAHERIKPFINQTPVFTSQKLNQLFELELFFKCENQQKAGAFKFRGATNAVQNLPEKEAARGVATHSSGNHAAALSLAARNRGIPAFIVMPKDAPEIKKEQVKKYGGQITYCEPTLQAREDTLAEVIKQTGSTFIPPYNHLDIIYGQATTALELIEEAGPFDIIMAPVGGGGLLSGTAISARHLMPACVVIGGEPANADDAYRSLKAGEIIPSVNPDTIADGLKTSLGVLNFEIIVQNVDHIFTASEESIREALFLLKTKAGILAEPSSAVPLAAILENREFFKGRKTGMIISGGNISDETYELLTRGVNS